MASTNSSPSNYSNCSIGCTYNTNYNINIQGSNTNNTSASASGSDSTDPDSTKADGSDDTTTKQKRTVAPILPPNTVWKQKPHSMVSTDEEGTVILPLNIIPTNKKFLSDDHLKQYLGFLPYLDKDFEEYKARKLEPSTDVIGKLRSALTEIMDSARTVARTQISNRVVHNFGSVMTGLPCHSISDVKKFIASTHSRDQMKVNPFFVSEMLIDNVLQETKSGSNFKTELINALIEEGNRKTPRWTISKKDGDSHSLVIYANSACVDALKGMRATETNAYGTLTCTRKPKQKARQPFHFYTFLNHGHVASYIRTDKNIIQSLKTITETPKKEDLKKILISHFKGEDLETKEDKLSGASNEVKKEDLKKSSISHFKGEDLDTKEEELSGASKEVMEERMNKLLLKAKGYAEQLNLDPSTLLSGFQIPPISTPDFPPGDTPNSFRPNSFHMASLEKDNCGKVASSSTYHHQFDPNLENSVHGGLGLDDVSHRGFLDVEMHMEQEVPSTKPINDVQETNDGSTKSASEPESRASAKSAREPGATKPSMTTNQAKNPARSDKQATKAGTVPSTKPTNDVQMTTNQAKNPVGSDKQATKAGTVPSTKQMNAILPPNFHLVERIHACKKIKGGRARKQYYVEWKEDVPGQWQHQLYSWENFDALRSQDIEDFHREYQEIGSAVRESLSHHIL